MCGICQRVSVCVYVNVFLLYFENAWMGRSWLTDAIRYKHTYTHMHTKNWKHCYIGRSVYCIYKCAYKYVRKSCQSKIKSTHTHTLTFICILALKMVAENRDRCFIFFHYYYYFIWIEFLCDTKRKSKSNININHLILHNKKYNYKIDSQMAEISVSIHRSYCEWMQLVAYF